MRHGFRCECEDCGFRRSHLKTRNDLEIRMPEGARLALLLVLIAPPDHGRAVNLVVSADPADSPPIVGPA